MEGLRGVAVFLVFWVHYSALIEPWISGHSNDTRDFIHSFGRLGVDLFFVLSGYLIYGTIIDKKAFSTTQYAWRRIKRIYPTFLVVTAVYILLSFVFPSESKLPEGGFASFVFVIQNLLLLPGIFDIEPINTVAWSLSYEVVYYLLIPPVIFLLRLKNWSVDHRILFWIAVSAIGFIAFTLLGGPIRLLMFLAGILTFELYTKKQIKLTKGGTRLLLISLALFGFLKFFEYSYHASLYSVFIFFILFSLCAFNPGTTAYKWLTFTPLRWLGNMSYSYYLIHGLTLKFFFLIFGKIIPNDFSSVYLYYWLWAPTFVMTLVSSFILFWIIERPLSLNK